MIRDLVIYPDDRLTSPCVPVTAFNRSLRNLVDDLFQTMYAYDGIGLAAPQIGDGRRVFVMDVRPGKKPYRPMSFINPELLSMSGEDEDVEGCLSAPGLALTVRRATYVHFASQAIDGTHHEAALRGLGARVFQHELDHTVGIMFMFRANVEATATT